MNERRYNFSAGPAILPEPALKNAQAALWNFQDTGIGILEHSHRGGAFTKTLNETIETCRKLANVPDTHEILFLQGGASSQFFMIPMNFLNKKTADYINTGAWSKKAMKEAALFGTVHEAASGESNGFSTLPQQISYSESPVYVHYTSNNTIAGTQFTSEPECPSGAFLVCDASSDIFCRPIDIAKYGIVYAGAQKNLGPSGVVLVIIRKDLIEQGASNLPTMLQYRTHAEKNSSFNTPPTFPIYMIGQSLKWLVSQGGLEAIHEKNQRKSKLLYSFLDNNDFFRPTVTEESRSIMNVCFRAPTEDLEAQFIAEAAASGFLNLKGHRSVGGMRASIYNAFPEKGVEALVEFMGAFAQKNA